MSGSTVSGGTVPANFSNGSGGNPAFTTFFPPGSTFTGWTGSGTVSVSGPLVITSSNSSVTVSGASAVDDANTAGGNSITTTTPSVVFASQNDTISSAAATTVYGSAAGVTDFNVSGANSSLTGGSGGFVGSVSGANSTLVGGSGYTLATVSGAGSLAVAGSGTSGITIGDGSTLTTNPLANTGTLIGQIGSSDSVIGGGGASTITASGNNNVFGFVQGHAGGTEVIIGFNNTDTLAFSTDYGYSLASPPSEAVTNGSDVITLSDGTQITLVGVDHKLFS